jgi:hypothetical protein
VRLSCQFDISLGHRVLNHPAIRGRASRGTHSTVYALCLLKSVKVLRTVAVWI